MSSSRPRSGEEGSARLSGLAHLSVGLLLLPLFAVSQDVVTGTFTVVRSDEACQPITARIIPSSTGTSSECVRVAVADVQSLAPTIRYRAVTKNDATNSSVTSSSELEVALGALIVHGSVTSAWNLTYKCPPPGYNGFSVESGSYCEVVPDTQIWATFTDTGNRTLRQIRVILSNSFPPIESLTPNAPPFGSALYDFPNGIDLGAANGTNGTNGTMLLICPASSANSTSSAVACPRLPAPATNLTARFNVQATGYFGTSALEVAIPSVWDQNDDRQLLTGLTTHSGSGGVQDMYANASGFYLHGYDSDIAPPYCYWFDGCGYDCQVTALADSRFLDSLGTWNVTWRVEEGDEMAIRASAPPHVIVRAYIGNGMSPGIVYLNAGTNGSWNEPSTALVGIDKVGSTLATSPPSYAYYWYTNFTLGPPDAAKQEPPATCFQSPAGGGDDGPMSDDPGSTSTSRADPTYGHRWAPYAVIMLCLAIIASID